MRKFNINIVPEFQDLSESIIFLKNSKSILINNGLTTVK